MVHNTNKKSSGIDYKLITVDMIPELSTYIIKYFNGDVNVNSLHIFIDKILRSVPFYFHSDTDKVNEIKTKALGELMYNFKLLTPGVFDFSEHSIFVVNSALLFESLATHIVNRGYDYDIWNYQLSVVDINDYKLTIKMKGDVDGPKT